MLYGDFAQLGQIGAGGSPPLPGVKRRRRRGGHIEVAKLRRLIVDVHADRLQGYRHGREGDFGRHPVGPAALLDEDAFVGGLEFPVDVGNRIADLLIARATRREHRKQYDRRATQIDVPQSHFSFGDRTILSTSLPACWISTGCSSAAARSWLAFAPVLPDRAAALYQTYAWKLFCGTPRPIAYMSPRRNRASLSP